MVVTGHGERGQHHADDDRDPGADPGQEDAEVRSAAIAVKDDPERQ